MSLNYEGGRKSITTYTGFVLTIIMGLTVFIYGVKQYIIMAERSQIIINSFLNFGQGIKESENGYGEA